MKRERKELVAPNEPLPTTLTPGEAKAIYNYVKGGASETALADYFNTTVTVIRTVVRNRDYKDKIWT